MGIFGWFVGTYNNKIWGYFKKGAKVDSHLLQ